MPCIAVSNSPYVLVDLTALGVCQVDVFLRGYHSWHPAGTGLQEANILRIYSASFVSQNNDIYIGV